MKDAAALVKAFLVRHDVHIRCYLGRDVLELWAGGVFVFWAKTYQEMEKLFERYLEMQLERLHGLQPGDLREVAGAFIKDLPS